MCLRSSGHFCVTDLSFLWLYAVRSQTVAVMAVPTMAAGLVCEVRGALFLVVRMAMPFFSDGCGRCVQSARYRRQCRRGRFLDE